jgi:hypothetical protein
VEFTLVQTYDIARIDIYPQYANIGMLRWPRDFRIEFKRPDSDDWVVVYEAHGTLPDNYGAAVSCVIPTSMPYERDDFTADSLPMYDQYRKGTDGSNWSIAAGKLTGFTYSALANVDGRLFSLIRKGFVAKNVRVSAIANSSDDGCIAARVLDENNMYVLSVKDPSSFSEGGGVFKLFKVVNGVTTELASRPFGTSNVGLQRGQERLITLEVVENVLKGTIDGKWPITAVDASLPLAGRIGLTNFQGSSTWNSLRWQQLEVDTTPDPHWDKVSLYMVGDAMQDISSKAHSPYPSGNVTVSPERAALGAMGFRFEQGHISVPGLFDDPALAMGSGDFTIEIMAQSANPLANLFQEMVSTRAANTSANTISWCLGLAPNGDAFMFTNDFSIPGQGKTVPAYDFSHWVLVRKGSAVRILKNGEVYAQGTCTFDLSANMMSIGSNWDGSEYWLGWMSYIRVTKGVARYWDAFNRSFLPYRKGPAV